MADSSATYTLDFAGGFTDGATAASGAATNLAASLGRLDVAAKGATGGTGALGAAATGNAKALGGIGGAAAEAAGGAKGAGINLRALGGVLSRGGGEAGHFSGGMLRMAAQLGRLGPAVAAAAVITVLTLALVAGTVAFVSFALSAADAARSQSLLAEAATGSAAGAAALTATALALASSTGLGVGKIQELGLGLARAGIQGTQLASALEAVSIVASTMGDAAGSKLVGIVEAAKKAKTLALTDLKLQGTGVGLNDVAAALSKKLGVSLAQAKQALQNGTVAVGAGLDALDDAVKSKLGGIAAKQSLGLDVQLARLKANLKGLFAGLNIEPFLAALHDVLSVFDQNTVAGKALSAAMKTIAQPLIDGFAAAGPFVKRMLLGMILVALQVAQVVLKVHSAIESAFSGSGFSGFIDGATIGKGIAYGLLAVIGLLALALVGFAAGALLVAAIFIGPFLLAGYAIYKLVGIVSDVGSQIVDYWNSLDFGAIGSSIIDGLVNGITNGASKVIGAVSNLGSSAVAALKGVLSIHSPSGVFMDLGANTAEGYAMGVDDGGARVDRSVADMVNAATPGRATSGGGRGGGGIHIENITITGVRDAEQLKDDDFFTRLATALERVFAEGGGDLELNLAGAP